LHFLPEDLETLRHLDVPTTERAIIMYADARAIRRAVLAKLTIFERALLWRWCIGVAVFYAGLFAALLAILVFVTHASLSETGDVHALFRAGR
jgi:hypothetical protein